MLLTAVAPELPATLNVAAFAPRVVGFKARLTMQDALLARETPVQVSPMMTNSGPDTDAARVPEAVSPELVTVKTVAVPVVPMGTAPRSESTIGLRSSSAMPPSADCSQRYISS